MHRYLFIVVTLFTSVITSSLMKDGGNDTVKNDLLTQKQCIPYKTYTKDNVFCICNEDGTWANEKCRKTFDETPEDKNNTNCEPNGYVTLGCNVCKCNQKGKVDYDYCTKNDCENVTNIAEVNQQEDNADRRASKIYYGACKPNTFYAISTCKFCFCTDKFKLVCKGGSGITKECTVGTLKLIECSTDLKKDIDTLLKDEDVVYKPEASASSTQLRKGKRHKNKKETTDEPNVSNEDNGSGTKDEKKKSGEFFTTIPFERADNFGQYAPASQEGKGSSKEDPQSLEQMLRDQADSDNKDEINDFAELEEQGNYYKKKLLRTGVDRDMPEFKNKAVETFLDPDTRRVLQNFIKRNPSRRNALMVLMPNKPCKPGSEFANKCNTCFCLKNGNTLCTKKICRDS